MLLATSNQSALFQDCEVLLKFAYIITNYPLIVLRWQCDLVLE